MGYGAPMRLGNLLKPSPGGRLRCDVALHTPLSPDDATRVCEAHGLGPCVAIEPGPAGSVNSNYVVRTAAARAFLRIYEEQDADGVAFEGALLRHLAQRGVPVPEPIDGPRAGGVRVHGKPVALFPVLDGRELRGAEVTADHLGTLGRALRTAHTASLSFPQRRPSRFDLAGVRARLQGIPVAQHPDLAEPVAELHAALDEVARADLDALPQGIVHGDLFRDNVRWNGSALRALLDWESAGTGPLLLDALIVVHAWTYASTFDWTLARAFFEGYTASAPLDARERSALREVAMFGACRFAVTRITDFHLRPHAVQTAPRDYRRFMQRLRVVAALTSDDLAARLGVG